MAKRNRRKKREREKGKKRGPVLEVTGQEVEDGEVKWEERLVAWSVVRANAKVKSFAFPPHEAETHKGGVPVSESSPATPHAELSSFSSRSPITPSRLTSSPPLPSPGSPNPKPPPHQPKPMPSSFQVIDRTFGLSACPRTIKS